MMTGAWQRMGSRWVIWSVGVLSLVGMAPVQAWSEATVWPVQMPYEAPPKSELVPDVSVTPNTKALTPEESPFVQAAMARVVKQPRGEPQDLVGALLLLCSPAGDWITGQALNVDGGFIMRN